MDEPRPGPAPLYPLGLRLEGRGVVVVGAGAVALRRVAGLLAAGADVTVVAPVATPALADLAATGRVRWLERPYRSGDLAGAWLALACTDRPDVNRAVAAEAELDRILCVRADDASAATAWVPASGRTGPYTLAVHADRDPRRAAAMRDRRRDCCALRGRLYRWFRAPARSRAIPCRSQGEARSFWTESSSR